MLKLVSEESSGQDPLVACVETVLEFHLMRTDLAGLVAELPTQGARWGMADLPAVADHLDLSLRIIKSEAAEIRETLTPIILPLEDDQFGVVMPGQDGQHDLMLPGQMPKTLTDAHLEQWTGGRVIVLSLIHI